MKFRHQANELDFDKSEGKDLGQFIFESRTSGVQLASALNGLAEGRDYRDDALTVACLKWAPDYLHKVQAGLGAVAP